jgi:hypothetical protein
MKNLLFSILFYIVGAVIFAIKNLREMHGDDPKIYYILIFSSLLAAVFFMLRWILKIRTK